MVSVGATLDNVPSHHIQLTDNSGNTIGLLCVGEDGQVLPAIAVQPYPDKATQIRQGKSKHADKIPPFEDVPIADLSGGFGMLHHDEDTSKYMYGYQLDTSQEGRAMLQGRPVYTTGIREFNEYQPASSVEMGWVDMYSGGTESYEVTFTVGQTSYDADKAIVYLRTVGSPGSTVDVSILTDGDVELKSKSINASDIPAYSPYEVEFEWTSTTTLTATDSFKIKVSYSGGDSSNYVQLWYDTTNSKFPYRVLDDTSDFSCIFFEYRRGFYCITQPEDRSVSKLYMLGYRGLADSNSGDKTKLNDSTRAWTADALIGYPAIIVAGPGSEEEQSWRTITDNDNVSLTMATWNVAHTTDTEYYILTEKWALLDTFDFYCTDAKVADKVLLLAAGADSGVRRMRWGNNDQTWTFEGDIGEASEVEEIFNGSKIVTIPHTNTHGRRKTYDFYVARNNNYDGDRVMPNTITRFQTPPFWGSPYIPTTRLSDGRAWTSDEITYVTQSADKLWARFDIGADFTTGVIGEKQFNPIVDLSTSEAIVCAVSTDVNIAAEQMKLILLDSKDNEISLWFPAILAEDDCHDDFKWVEIALHAEDTAPTHDYIDLSLIKRAQISLAADLGAQAQTLKIGKSGMWGITRADGQGQFVFEFGERVNGLMEYGGGSGQVTRKPWAGTTKNVYYLEGDHILPIYLQEMEELEHERNCELFMVNDVYAWWNLEKKIQRYYAGQLDNIGPEVDHPLPATRAGFPCTGASYPGKAIVGWDCEASGYSWVGYRRNHGWHELYRSPIAGARIRSVHSLARMDTVDQLYVSEGADIMWLPLSTHPETDSDYNYNYHGHFETGRIYGSIRETEKYFHSLELIQENHAQGSTGDFSVKIRAYYRTNNHSDYTLIGDFDTFPNEEINIGAYNQSGNWIQFLIEFETEKADYSPILVAGILDMVERNKVKDQLRYQVIISSGYDDCLDETVDTVAGTTKNDWLDTWKNQPLPLKLNSNSAFEDNKYIMLEPANKRLVDHKVDVTTGAEIRQYELILLKVED